METMTQWIDVKDQLPEDGQIVVVFDPYNHPTVWPAKWNQVGRTFDSNGGWFNKDEITHWMPLPPPPKSKEWMEGFKAAEHDEASGWVDVTDCPYQPTSPWTYPDGHAGPPTKEAVEWEAGYAYRQFEHHRGVIVCKVTVPVGSSTIEMYL